MSSRRGYVLGCFSETALRNIETFQPISIIEGKADSQDFFLKEDALHLTLDPLFAEITHLGIDISTLIDSGASDFNVIQETQTNSGSINGLHLFINNGRDKFAFVFFNAKGIEVIGYIFTLLGNHLWSFIS